MRRSLEVVGLSALAVQIWITYQALAGPDRLPDRIPTHFDAAGNPNGWGSPSVLLFLVVLTIGIYLLITVVSLFPAGFNFPVQVTAQNRLRLEELGLNMVILIKVELACLFATLQWAMIQAARSGEGRLPPLLVPGFLILIFATVGWHLIAMVRTATSGT